MKDPISLENLPQHLKNLKESGSFDENLVVDIGVVTPSNNINILKRGGIALVFCLLLFLGFISYDTMQPKNIMVSLSVEDIQSVPGVVSDMNGEVVSIKKNEDDSYEIVLSIKQNSFIERLRKIKW